MEAKLREGVEGRELLVSILTLLNARTLHSGVMETILGRVKDFAGCDAVGIRLCKGDDFPFCFSQGFPDEFIHAEDSICLRDDSGEIVRDSDAKPLLDGVYGKVIRQETDPSLDFFTEGGSFWTNALSKLLASEQAVEPGLAARAGCTSHTYQSVVLSPLRSGGEVIGLLQLNDSRENCFTLESVEFLELVAGMIVAVCTRVEEIAASERARDELKEQVAQRTQELSTARLSLEKEIQDRKIVEQELVMSQERLKLAMEAANLGSWDWNLDTDEVYFDERWTQMFGSSAEARASDFRSWQNRIHRDDKLKVFKTLARHLENHSQYFEVEYRLKTRSGKWRWILDRGKVVHANDLGRPVRMAGIVLDITHRKEIEEELHRTAERFRGIFDSARDCIFLKNSRHQYTHVNPAFATMVGCPESDIIGWTDSDLYDPQSAKNLRRVDERVLHGESVEQEHTRLIHRVPRTFLDTKVPMSDSTGKIVGILGISREITDRKRTEPDVSGTVSGIEAPVMLATMRSVRLAAETDIIVLLMGESGVGKDHLARYIHDNSKLAGGPFFSINCAAVTQELAEAELFGYEAGAFTGARGPKRGLLELAEGGTILLNEIGDLSLPLQAKLLTFLDTRQFTRVGGVKLLTVHARLIAATNRNLGEEVSEGRFRRDLFYRFDVFTIRVPPLRERVEDISHLVLRMTEELSNKMGLDSVAQIDPEALHSLEEYPWPGNVRELRNVLERALILCDKKRITADDLSINQRSQQLGEGKTWSYTIAFPENQTINDVTMDVKRHLVTEALRRTGGSRKRAAELLGISPDSLKHYLQIFDLHRIIPFQPRLTV